MSSAFVVMYFSQVVVLSAIVTSVLKINGMSSGVETWALRWALMYCKVPR